MRRANSYCLSFPQTTIRFLFAACICIMTISVSAQQKKFYFPAWTFQKKNARILGVSPGLYSMNDMRRNTNTFGLRLEVPGTGLIVGLIPSSPLAETDSAIIELKKEPVSEKVYGFSISALGTTCHCNVNGVAVNGIGQVQNQINGLSFSPISFVQTHNGIQLGVFNYTYKMNGIQIGFVNNSKRTRGIQIGLLNRNEKRKLPIINWNFSK